MQESGRFAVVGQETAGMLDVLERFCDEQANHAAAWWFFLFSHSLPQNIMDQSYDDAASYSGSGLSSCNPPAVSEQNPNNVLMR